MDFSIWAVLMARVCKHPHTDLYSLKEALLTEWDNLEIDMIKKVIDDFPKRVQACIRAKGKHFEWMIDDFNKKLISTRKETETSDKHIFEKSGTFLYI